MKIEIKNRFTGETIATDEADNLLDALVKLVARKTYLGNADLRGAYLCGADLGGADLRGADLRGADLGCADLRNAYLRGADLGCAYLGNADLRGADLGGADLRGADIPIVPNLHSHILESLDAGGKLDMGGWHICETTHCRAGWAIHLAGQAGYDLEDKIGSCAAGALISVASCPQLDGKVPDFYASDQDALSDIRRLAELEKAT